MPFDKKKSNHMELRTFFAFLLVAFAAFCLGAVRGIDFKNKEAVAAGVAHWTVNAEGKVNFEYNKN